jgi:hypothetical protein
MARSVNPQALTHTLRGVWTPKDPPLFYYYATDHFLFVLSLLQNSPEVRQHLERIFKDRVMERFGAEMDSLSLAARIIAATVTVDPWMTVTVW